MVKKAIPISNERIKEVAKIAKIFFKEDEKNIFTEIKFLPKGDNELKENHPITRIEKPAKRNHYGNGQLPRANTELHLTL